MRPAQSHRTRVFAFALVLPLLIAGTAIASPPPYRLQWGTQGSGDGQFLTPSGLAVDAAGNVYVADYDNNRVQKFSSDGTFLLKFGMGQISNPIGIAIDPAGSIFVLEYWGHRVSRFDANGVYQSSFGTFGSGNGNFLQPRAIAIDASGSIYVCDGAWQTVQKFANDGTFLARWGTWGASGSANGQFSTPWGIAADASGSIYVSDTGNNRVQKLNSTTGAFVSAWGTLGSGNGQFNQPQNIAASSLGLIYVVDSANSRIQRFTPSGTFVDAWGSAGAGNQQFNSPRGVAIDAAGTAIYVADTNNHRIVAFGCASSGIAPRLATMRTWWRLDETAGSTAADLFATVPLNNVGSVAHNPATLVNNSLKLTGAAYLASTMPGAAVDFEKGDYSIETWYRSSNTATSVRTLVDHRVTGRGYSMFISFGHLGTQMADGNFTNFTSNGASLNDGVWHHLVVSVQRGNSTGGKLFVDGSTVLTFDPTVRPGSLTNAGSFRIGQAFDNSSVSLNGDLDEVGLYSSALTEADVQAAYCAGALGRSTSCGTPVAITGEPAAVTAVAGAYATLQVSATGTPPFQYQWEKNGVPLVNAGYVSGTGTQELVFGRAVVGDVGDYRVRVTNICGSTYSAVAHLAVCTPPTISISPHYQGAFVGSTATITATSNGEHFQWRHAGVNVGTDSPTLTISPVLGISHGYYDVVVTNGCGTKTSEVALVSVAGCGPPPSLFAFGPADVDVAVGSPASFSIFEFPHNAGCPPVSLQWYRNGQAIPGATASTFSIPSTIASDAGNYQCSVSNNAGWALSRVAALTMANPTVRLTQNRQNCSTVTIGWESTPSTRGKVFYGGNWHAWDAPTDSSEESPYQPAWNAVIQKPVGDGIYYHVRVIDQLGRASWSPNHVVYFTAPAQDTDKLLFSTTWFATLSDDFGPGQGVRVRMSVKNLGCESFTGEIRLGSAMVGEAPARDPATNAISGDRLIVNGLAPLQTATMPTDLVFNRSELGPNMGSTLGGLVWWGRFSFYGDEFNGSEIAVLVAVPPSGGVTP